VGVKKGSLKDISSFETIINVKCQVSETMKDKEIERETDIERRRRERKKIKIIFMNWTQQDN